MALSLGALVPPPDLFLHPSRLHGQAHVARVMVHAFRLLDATETQAQAAQLWAAVYLHDIARTHDGRCYAHGARAVARLKHLPAVEALLRRGGVTAADRSAIETAVIHHCKSAELKPAHSHYALTVLLKDADALDRVRLNDLDPSFLRHDEARRMLAFAQELFEASREFEPGPSYFECLWPVAQRL